MIKLPDFKDITNLHVITEELPASKLYPSHNSLSRIDDFISRIGMDPTSKIFHLTKFMLRRVSTRNTFYLRPRHFLR